MSERRAADDDGEREDAWLRRVASLLYDDAAFFAGILTPDGTVRFANDTALDAVGATEDEVRGEAFWESPWWTHDAVQQDELREHVATAATGETRHFTATHRDRHDERIDVDVTVRPLTVPDDQDIAAAVGSEPPGRGVVGIVVTGQDVSERADLAADRQSTVEALEGLYETAADTDQSFKERVRRLLRIGKERLGLREAFYTRIDGGVQTIEAADAAHPLLQEGEQADLADSYCKETIADEDRTRFISDVSRTEFTEDDAYEQYGLNCYIGSKLEVNGHIHGTVCFADTEPRDTPLDAGELAFVDLLAEWLRHELEHREQQRRVERQNERLDRYADVVSHDLRNPLNVATGHLDLAADLVDDDAALEHLATVEESLDRMNELVQEMRTLAQEGEVVGEPEAVSLAAVADRAATTALPDAATLDLDLEAGEVVSADPERLQTALENLFSNAVNHGGDDVSVTVGSVQPSDGKGWSSFYVADDGPGFEEADPSVVFEEGHTTREASTGYGLSIVAAIADAHDWGLSAGGSAAGGARVEFTNVSLEPALE